MTNGFVLVGHNVKNQLDRFNDRLTSYRLMLYFLIVLIIWAVIGSFINKVSFDAQTILASTVWLVAICWVVNKIIAGFLDIPSNKESDLITGLILSLILTPASSLHDYAVLAAAAIAAIATKYVITVYRSHIFNPAAAGAFVAGEIFHKYASWWIGTKFITPLVIIGGILILRKMKRFSLAGVFLAVYILYLIFGTNAGGNLHFLSESLLGTQVIFFAVVMLIEPLTSPTRHNLYLAYGILVGLLYSIPKLKLSPEEALLIGNLFTLVVAPNRRYEMEFIRKIHDAKDIYSYVFAMPPRLKFNAGQYMEWTISHNNTDSRGNRRYFTIASAPTENGVMITVKQPSQASAFKQKLDLLKPNDIVLASHVAGDFILPKNKSQKIAFLAGGVGITPFRSMVKQVLDNVERRDLALLYAVSNEDEIAFRDLFKRASEAGLKSHYIVGHLEESTIKKLLPDYKQRRLYVSGPYGFVNNVETALLRLGVKPSNIITDYFPGYG